MRNESQDSAVILHDIEVAKKFPSDWEEIKCPPTGGRRQQRPAYRTLHKLALFIGRALTTVERVYYASKELSYEELSGIAPGTAKEIVTEIRRQKPSKELLTEL